MTSPPGTMLTPSLSQNAQAISSLTMSIAASGSPPTLWTNISVGVWVLYRLPVHGFGFCGALMLAPGGSYGWSSVFGLLGGPKSTRPHVSGLSYYGTVVSWGVTEGLTRTTIKMRNDN
jgi:hypothetical protein